MFLKKKKRYRLKHLKKKTKSILIIETNNHLSIQIPNQNTYKLIYDPQHKRGNNKIKKEKNTLNLILTLNYYAGSYKNRGQEQLGFRDT